MNSSAPIAAIVLGLLVGGGAADAQPGPPSRPEPVVNDGSGLSAYERMAGFVRLWSEVKYNFVFLEKVPELDWDKTLDEYLPQVAQAQNTEEYYRILQRCVASLKDGHTTVSLPHHTPERGELPLRLEMIEGKVLITAVAPAAAYAQPQLVPGLEITHIDGRAVSDILEKDVYPYVAASTRQNRDQRALRQLLEGDVDSTAVVRVRDVQGRTLNLRMARLGLWEFPHVSQFELCELGDGVMYVALGTFGTDRIVSQFQAVFEKLRRAKALIIDIRHNGGGSSGTGYAIIGHLIDKPIQGSRWKTRQYRPAFRAWGRDNDTWYEGEPRTIEPATPTPFLGPVVLLIGPETVSAAEDFAVALHASSRATLIGRRTAGTTGQPLLIDLPGGGKARICTKWDSYPDGREFVGIGVIPDIEIGPTQESIGRQKDPELEKALQVLAGKVQFNASAVSTAATVRRRSRLAGQEEWPDLAGTLRAAKMEYDAVMAAHARKDLPGLEEHASNLSHLFWGDLMRATMVDDFLAQLGAKEQLNEQMRYTIPKATALKRQMEALCAGEEEVTRACHLIKTIGGVGAEFRDHIRDNLPAEVSADVDRLTKTWAEFCQLMSPKMPELNK
jgi:carboxyl-terminal processing protease